MSEKPLAGRSIVVTRPAWQAERLAALVRAAGGEAIVFPVIEIGDAEDPRALHALIDRLDEFDLAVFVSPNAANKGMQAIAARRLLPEKLAVAAVGPGTARELAALGIANLAAPVGRGDSEALLALAELAEPQGKRVIVFRGEVGDGVRVFAIAQPIVVVDAYVAVGFDRVRDLFGDGGSEKFRRVLYRHAHFILAWELAVDR